MAESDSKSPRRLHPLTLVVCALVMAVLVVCNVGGDRDELEWLRNHHMRCNHGWPATYVVRDIAVEYEEAGRGNLWMVTGTGDATPGNVHLLWEMRPWSLFTGVLEFRPAALALNVAVALVLTFAAAWICQRFARRRFQFRTKHLLLLVCFVALLLAWYARRKQRYEMERAAVQRIEAAGGITAALPALPDWLAESPGFRDVRVFDEVLVVENYAVFEEPQLSDVLRQCEKLESLCMLNMSATDATDEALEHVGRLHALVTLDLSGSGLERLGLTDFEFDEESLKHLQGMKSLEVLSVHFRPVTNKGLRYLHGLPNLRELDLDGTNVDDGAIPDLARLQQLEELWLSDTALTPEGIERLKRALPDTRTHE